MKKIIFLCIIATLSGSLLAPDSSTYHYYLWANYNQYTGNTDSALHFYKKLLSSDNSIYTYKGYLNFLFDTGQFGRIVELFPHITDKFKKDGELQLLFALALEQSGKKEEAYKRVIELSETFKSNAEIVFRAAQIYISTKEYTNALTILDSYLNSTPRRPNNFIFYFLKSSIYIQLGKYEQALENVEKCLEMHPHFNKGWLLFATLQEQMGKLKEAIRGYATFLELSNGNAEIEQHLFSLMLKYKLVESDQSSLIFERSCFDIAVTLFKRKQYKQALAQINKCLEQTPQDIDSKLLKIDILAAMNDFDAALATLTHYFQENPENSTWIKSTYLLIHTGVPVQKIVATLINFTDKQEKSLPAHLYLADLYLRNNDNTQAVIHLERALSLTTDKELLTKIMYQLGLLYFENEQFDQMGHILEKGYSLNAHFSPLINALAYYYCTKGKNIQRAEELIKLALQQNENNPHYLDTLALVWYKQNKLTKSRDLLEKLVIQEHDDATILLHLAKTYAKLNNNETAAAYAKKAESLIQYNHEKRLLKTVQQRLLSKT